MLEVVSLEEASALVKKTFAPLVAKGSGVDVASCESGSQSADASCGGTEIVALSEAVGRFVAHDVIALEGVPAFDRSMVDGFALVASDTFGCSDALPALLSLAGEIQMGADPPCACAPGQCLRIPTGGQVPDGADAVVMLEYCEEYGDGSVGVSRPVAPGDGIAFENDDVKPGQVLICAGTKLLPHHVGTLASLGVVECAVRKAPTSCGSVGDVGADCVSADGVFATCASDGRAPAMSTDSCRAANASPKRLCVGIISTGDEIVDAACVPVASQMRDVNAPLLAAAVEQLGAQAKRFPIVPDDYDTLLRVMRDAVEQCDMVLVSGGSSAGEKDNTARVLSVLGTLLFHGIAVKPGKPTMCADVGGKPVFGLPGHPVAAYFMFLELARPLLTCEDNGIREPVQARLAATLPSNHGRAELVAVRLEEGSGGKVAVPIIGKSGLISLLCKADGYVRIGRNQEGAALGAMVEVELFN